MLWELTGLCFHSFLEFFQTFTCVSIKFIRLQAQDFYCMIVNDGASQVKYHTKLRANNLNCLALNLLLFQNFI